MDVLGGQAKTLMFVHMSLELNVVGETLSILKFAEQVTTIKTYYILMSFCMILN